MSSFKYYTGIGSRTAPDHVLRVIMYLSKRLSQYGYVLRSGNAEGCDQAFAGGILGNMAEIWLPWDGFNKDFQDEFPDMDYKLVSDDDWEAIDSVEKYHPSPENLSEAGKLFMTRNYRQVVGYDGEPDSEFVVCWTPEGRPIGGTAQAIRIAEDRSIPVYNLFNMTSEEVIKEIEKINLIS